MPVEVYDSMEELKSALREIGNVLGKRLDDHDILVRLVTQQDNLIAEVRHNNKLREQAADDHEERIRTLEARINWLWGALGVSTAAGITISKFL